VGRPRARDFFRGSRYKREDRSLHLKEEKKLQAMKKDDDLKIRANPDAQNTSGSIALKSSVPSD